MSSTKTSEDRSSEASPPTLDETLNWLEFAARSAPYTTDFEVAKRIARVKEIVNAQRTNDAQCNYACVACATPIESSGMCERCSRAWGIGAVEERNEIVAYLESERDKEPRRVFMRETGSTLPSSSRAALEEVIIHIRGRGPANRPDNPRMPALLRDAGHLSGLKVTSREDRAGEYWQVTGPFRSTPEEAKEDLRSLLRPFQEDK